MFTDEQFEQAIKELDEPDLTDYEFFTESTGVKIYRKYNSVSIVTDLLDMNEPSEHDAGSSYLQSQGPALMGDSQQK